MKIQASSVQAYRGVFAIKVFGVFCFGKGDHKLISGRKLKRTLLI